MHHMSDILQRKQHPFYRQELKELLRQLGLERGDTVTWTTKLGTRTYEVTSVEKVKETDTSGTAPSAENMLTLYTCVRNQREYRWQVQAVEVV